MKKGKLLTATEIEQQFSINEEVITGIQQTSYDNRSGNMKGLKEKAC